MKYAPLLLVLAACVVFSQEKQKNRAEELFEELEAKLSKADTIQCEYRAVMQFKESEREKEVSKAGGSRSRADGDKRTGARRRVAAASCQFKGEPAAWSVPPDVRPQL
jgi:hypothetical protein